MKAVFLDVDNTLTDPISHAVPESAAKAIFSARKKGVRVFAATGRNTLNTAEAKVIEHIEFDGYVGMNGAICHIGKEEPFYSLPLDTRDVEAAFVMHKELDFAMQISTLYEIYLTNENEKVTEYDAVLDIARPGLLPEGFEFKDVDVYALMPYAGEDIEALIMPRLKNSLAVRWGGHSFDIIPKAGGKHVGIQKMMERFGLKREEVLAIGDGGNDITMLEYVGVGVAMNHASELVKKSADFIAPKDRPIEAVFKKYGIIN